MKIYAHNLLTAPTFSFCTALCNMMGFHGIMFIIIIITTILYECRLAYILHISSVEFSVLCAHKHTHTRARARQFKYINSAHFLRAILFLFFVTVFGPFFLEYANCDNFCIENTSSMFKTKLMLFLLFPPIQF